MPILQVAVLIVQRENNMSLKVGTEIGEVNRSLNFRIGDLERKSPPPQVAILKSDSKSLRHSPIILIGDVLQYIGKSSQYIISCISYRLIIM